MKSLVEEFILNTLERFYTTIDGDKAKFVKSEISIRALGVIVFYSNKPLSALRETKKQLKKELSKSGISVKNIHVRCPRLVAGREVFVILRKPLIEVEKDFSIFNNKDLFD